MLENRAIKVVGGIKGIGNLSLNLDGYFISTAEISNIITSFCERFDISEATERDAHYQISGSKYSRIETNIIKLTNAFEEGFSSEICCMFFVTRKN